MKLGFSAGTLQLDDKMMLTWLDFIRDVFGKKDEGRLQPKPSVSQEFLYFRGHKHVASRVEGKYRFVGWVWGRGKGYLHTWSNSGTMKLRKKTGVGSRG